MNTVLTLTLTISLAIAVFNGIEGGNNSVTYDIPIGKGDYVTGAVEQNNYDLEWLSKFKIVHIGSIEEPLNQGAIEYLRMNGVEIILADDWLPAGYYYPDNNTPFMEWVYENRYEVTLNPDGPFPHCWENGYDWKEYYFDFAVESLVYKRAEYIVDGLKKCGYNGIFFDWGNGLFLREHGYESINATYYSRHSIPYSEAAANFISRLRKMYPEIIIENNQGYREAEYYLPVLDYDMAESYITGCDYYGKKLYIDGYGLIEVPETVYYPVSIDEFHGNLNDTLYYVNYLCELKEKYGKEHFRKIVYMNYAAPEFIFIREEKGHRVYKPTVPRNAIYFGYAIAKLVNQISYTEVPWNHSYEKCNVYFYDIGEPIDEHYRTIDGGYIRYFSNGFVIVGEWQKETKIDISLPLLQNGVIYDAFEERWIEVNNGVVTITIKPRIDNLTGKMAPSGRIFIYPKKENVEVSILKPRKGSLYFMDREILVTGREKAIIIGRITVEAVTNGDKIEFYVDDSLKYIDEIAPFKWAWDELVIGKHEIKVIAYGEGEEAEDSIEVFALI